MAYYSPPEPETPNQLDPDARPGEALAPPTGCAPPFPRCSFCRYSSEIRTGCANKRPSGSVRGAPGNWCPYRDRQSSWADAIISILQWELSLLRAPALDSRRHCRVAHLVRRRKAVVIEQATGRGNFLASRRRDHRADPMRLDDTREGVARTCSRTPNGLLRGATDPTVHTRSPRSMNRDLSPTDFHSPPSLEEEEPFKKSFSASPKAPEMIRKSATPNGIV